MKSTFNDAYAILFSDFLYIKTYVMGTCMNCLDLSRQFKRVPTTYVFYIKTYVMGTCMNCLDLSRQFKRVPTTYNFFLKK